MPDAHDFPNTILTAAGYKNGSSLDVATNEWEDIHAFMNILSENGVSCVLNTDSYPDTPVYTSLQITRQPMVERAADVPGTEAAYSAEELRAMWDRRNVGDPAVEHAKGGFLGYPADATDAVLTWHQISDEVSDDDSVHIKPRTGSEFADQFADEYGLTIEEQDKLRFLSNYSDAPTGAAFERMFQTVETRYSVLEQLETLYGVSLTDTDDYW